MFVSIYMYLLGQLKAKFNWKVAVSTWFVFLRALFSSACERLGVFEKRTIVQFTEWKTWWPLTCQRKNCFAYLNCLSNILSAAPCFKFILAHWKSIILTKTGCCCHFSSAALQNQTNKYGSVPMIWLCFEIFDIVYLIKVDDGVCLIILRFIFAGIVNSTIY